MRLPSKSLMILSAICASLLPGGCARTEHTEAVTAEIEAAQMMGRKAARPVLISAPADSAGLRKCLREITKTKNAYDSLGRHDCAAAYDSAFISTLRSVNPPLAERVSATKY